MLNAAIKVFKQRVKIILQGTINIYLKARQKALN